MSFFISSSKAKKWSLLIFELQLPMLLFLRLFNTTGNEKWSIYVFYGYFIYPLPSSGSRGYFQIIYRCHHVSFLVCLHAIDPHYYKLHQEAFLLPKKEPGIPINSMALSPSSSFDTQFSIFYFQLFSTTTKKKVD